MHLDALQVVLKRIDDLRSEVVATEHRLTDAIEQSEHRTLNRVDRLDQHVNGRLTRTEQGLHDLRERHAAEVAERRAHDQLTERDRLPGVPGDGPDRTQLTIWVTRVAVILTSLAGLAALVEAVR